MSLQLHLLLSPELIDRSTKTVQSEALDFFFLAGLEPKLVTLSNCGEDNGPPFPWAQANTMVQSYEVFTSRCCTVRGYMPVASPRSSFTPNFNGDTSRKQICAFHEGT